ncbi:hypothetical protein ACPPVT_22225 [Angustibacter sp. McL0619]|uniref:hypothetical protein n=1 Tax=Angustibacter sp. McL0619 TaxID=3415676 RepID=UPI003CF6C75B
MRGQIVVVLGTLAGVVLAYLLQSLTAARQRRYDIADRARRERLEAAAALPAALVGYRHAQIARRMAQLRTGNRSEPLRNEVRSARAEAWSALYRLDLLLDDRPVRDAAYELMGRIKELKTIDDPVRLDDAGTEVHWGIQAFIKLARTRLGFADPPQVDQISATS